jgi:lipoprotein-anchoring transpeptidase ErfK/SrfK
MAKKGKLSWLPWKSGLFLLAAVAVVQFIPSPVPARDAAQAEAIAAPAVAAVEIAAAAPRADPASVTPPKPAQAPSKAAEPVAVADYAVHAELPVGRLLRPGEWAWTDGTAPAAGETLIVVNLRAQLLSLYRGGYEIGRARIIYGADEKPTPTGTFPILEKDAVHFSNLYGGAPMPYMLRLTRDGVSIHGSGEIAEDLVTHGCVGLPTKFARMLFNQVKVGDRVVVWRG